MITALALALAAAGPVSQPAALRPADPPIKLWISSSGEFVSGDRARVHVRSQQDGYVVVVRADADGRLRVLYPIDPGADNFVRGGDKREIRSRGDREAFIVDDRGGDGLVLAAWSASPFHFNDFVRGDHWDYAALDTLQMGDDKEAGLLSVIQDMAGTAHFDYDALPYSVGSVSAYYRTPDAEPCWGCGAWGGWAGLGWGWPGFRFGFGWGGPVFWGAPACAYWGWGCGVYAPGGFGFWHPFFGYGRPFYGYRFGAWGPRPYAFGAYGVRPNVYRSGLLIDRVGPSAGLAQRSAVGGQRFASRARPAPVAIPMSRGWSRSSGGSYMAPRSGHVSSGARSGGGGMRAGRSGGSRGGGGGGGGRRR